MKNKIIAMADRNLDQTFKTFETNDYMTAITVKRAKTDISDFLHELK